MQGAIAETGGEFYGHPSARVNRQALTRQVPQHEEKFSA